MKISTNYTPTVTAVLLCLLMIVVMATAADETMYQVKYAFKGDPGCMHQDNLVSIEYQLMPPNTPCQQRSCDAFYSGMSQIYVCQKEMPKWNQRSGLALFLHQGETNCNTTAPTLIMYYSTGVCMDRELYTCTPNDAAMHHFDESGCLGNMTSETIGTGCQYQPPGAAKDEWGAVEVHCLL